jgi:hypothetical protein
VVGPFAVHQGLGPQPFHDLEILVHDLAAPLERDAHGVELALVPARRHTHQETPLRQLIHAGELLGEQHGIAQGQDQDPGTELDARGSRRDRREHGQGFDNREIRINAEEDVVPHPE